MKCDVEFCFPLLGVHHMTDSGQIEEIFLVSFGEDYRATLTRAASKFPLKVVLPFGVVAPAAGSAEAPAGTIRTPAPAANVPLAADNLAEAASNEYGGGLLVVAESA